MKLGDFALDVGTTSGVFELNLLQGAQFGFTGGSWTDANGQITGGIVPIPVAIPEPSIGLLLLLGAVGAFRHRRTRTA